jgi:transposase InsO family protein
MRNQKEVERRVKILGFWQKHGEKATRDAFGTSCRTFFRWQELLDEAQGKLPSLDLKSTAPKQHRQCVYDPLYLERAITLRRSHHHLGKKKIAIILNVSESYAGRTLGDLKKRGLLPQQRKMSLYARQGTLREQTVRKRKKLRRPKEKRGIEIDTVIRFIDGTKRYIYTAIDVERKFAFAAAYTNHSSASATDFLGKVIIVAPFPVTEIQTDNGSEFAALFEDACKRLGIVHFHTYPRCPKMNACIERFNRTLSEDFISYHRADLRDDLVRFNDLLVDWLLWYNTERPHQSLGMLSPLQYIVRNLSAEECQMWWTSTKV